MQNVIGYFLFQKRIFFFQGAIIGILCGNAFTIWLLVGSLLKSGLSKTRQNGDPIELPTYTEGCEKNSSWSLDVHAIARNHTRPEKIFFYIPDGYVIC